MARPDVKLKIGAEDRTKAAFASVRGGLASVERAARPVALAVSAVAGSTALLVRNSLNAGDVLAKTADKLGVTTKELAGFHHAAELTGVSTSTANLALQRMTRRVSEAAVGLGEARGALQELGLDAVRLNQIGPNQAFLEVAEAMGKVSNQADKVRLAMKLFDSEGVALVNTLAVGKDGLIEMAQEADRLGIALSRTDAAKMEAANDAMTRAQSAVKGVGNVITVEVAPVVEALADSFTDAAVAGNGFASGVHNTMSGLVSIVGVAADTIALIEYGWLGARAAFFKLQVSTLTGMDRINKSVSDFVNDTLGGLADALRHADFIPGVEGVADKLDGVSVGYEDMSGAIRNARGEAVKAAVDFQIFQNQSLPSDRIKEGWKAVGESAAKAAEEVAKARQSTGPNVEPVTDSGALDKLKKSLRTQTEAVEAAYADRLAVIRAAMAVEGADQQELGELIARATRERNEKLKKIDEDRVRDLKKNTAGVAAEMGDLWDRTGESISRGFGTSVADALISATSLKEGLLGTARAVVRETIAGLVQIGVQELVLNRIRSVLRKQEAGEVIGQQAAIATAAAPAAAAVTASTGGTNIPIALAGLAALAAASAGYFAAREHGGPVTAGVPYLVGERGPEIFTPSASGQIIPNNQITQASRQPAPVTVNINAVDALSVRDLLTKQDDIFVNAMLKAQREDFA